MKRGRWGAIMRSRFTSVALLVSFCLFAVNVAYAADAKAEELLDPGFIFRGALSIAFAVLAWYANKMAGKIEELERKSNELQIEQKRAVYVEAMVEALRKEDVQLQTQLNLMREMMLRDYHTKGEIREHHGNMEKLLGGVREEVAKLVSKMETMQERLHEFQIAHHK